MDTKLTHLDEYKTLRDEIMLCQHEIHRTWLWATIAAAAAYTWLPLHKSDIQFPGYAWVIPPLLLIFCAMRNVFFRLRIRWISQYLEEIEEDAFGQDKKLPGIGHFKRNRVYKADRYSFYGAIIVWLVLIVFSTVLSWNLSRMKSNNTPPMRIGCTATFKN
jgi:hypothetical protein